MSRKGVPNKTNKYETVVLPRLSEIEQWCLDGETDEVIYKKLGISHDTWYRYIRDYPVLSELVVAGKRVTDNRVENALLRTALGFEFEEIKTIIEEDRNGKKRTRIEKMKRYMPPNPTAQAFWLKNRRKEEWGDRKEIHIDTTAVENARKQMFLEMIEGELEVQEDIEDGYLIEDSFDQEK